MPFAFDPVPGVEGWQVSNPPILAMAPVRVSLDLFAEVGMDALRARSVRLTGFLERLLDVVAARRKVELITPREPDRRGAQLSVMVDDAAAVTAALFERLRRSCRRPAAERHPARAGPALQHLRRLLARRRRPRRRPGLIPSECLRPSECRARPLVARHSDGSKHSDGSDEVDEAGLADVALVGELGELDLRRQHRLDPHRAAAVGRRRRRVERALVGLQLGEAPAELVEPPLREPGADAAGERQLTVDPAPDEQGAEARPSGCRRPACTRR